MDIQHNGGVAIVFNRLAFSEIVRGCHKVERLRLSGDRMMTRYAQFSTPRPLFSRRLIIGLFAFFDETGILVWLTPWLSPFVGAFF
jgi:hypothetical protein